MQDQRSPRSDFAAQRAVLSLAREAHPKSLTIPELAAEIDQAERAVVDLVGAGLLDCRGISTQPSAAALHIERLELP
jgi:hypothetical protein